MKMLFENQKLLIFKETDKICKNLKLNIKGREIEKNLLNGTLIKIFEEAKNKKKAQLNIKNREKQGTGGIRIKKNNQ